MSAIDDYLEELARALRVRGRARRRILAECRDHLLDASEVHGAEEAVRRFGPAAEVADAFDAEIGVRRALPATLVAALGVVGVGWSTLTLVHAADPAGRAVPVWAAVFFLSAQASAVAIGLALLRAAALRRAPASLSAAAGLSRCNAVALGLALLTMFAAGAAVPGHGAAWRLLLGPVLAALAGVVVLRAWRPARGAARTPAIRLPFPVLVGTIAAAALAGFIWDHQDQGTLTTSVTAAGIEAMGALAGYVLLGPALGLRRGRRRVTPAGG